jgi:hypothetical protein
VIVSQPTHGVLTGTAPDLLYTPAPDHHGVDRFTFRASDGVLNSPVTEVLVQIAAVNDAPVAESQQVSAAASGRRPITLVAADVDADPLTYRIVDGPAGGVLEGTPPNLVYVAPASAIEDSFTWTANDGVADSLIATVDVTVGDTNEPPIANSLVAQEDTARDVELWASDPDGDLLTYEITVAPNLGVLEGTGSQRSYVPEPDAWGVDSFLFRVSDGLAWSDEVTVQLTVVSVNDDPVADAMSAIEGHGGEDFVIDLSASDVDGDAVTFVLDSAPAVGTLDAPASGPWTWTPPADVEGTYLLSWHAEDPDGAWSNVVEVELVVLGAGPDWVATADAYESAGNYVLTVDATEGVLANDALGASYSCQIAAVSSTTELGGSVLLGCDGGFTYTRRLWAWAASPTASSTPSRSPPATSAPAASASCCTRWSGMSTRARSRASAGPTSRSRRCCRPSRRVRWVTSCSCARAPTPRASRCVGTNSSSVRSSTSWSAAGWWAKAPNVR